MDISVILPVHNGMPYLPESVNSILQQTYTRFELIIVDDGSTDETPVYLRSVCDPRLKYYRTNKQGIVEALNFGLTKATAPLVARMDADDIAEPARLEKQHAFMMSDRGCVVVGCDCWLIDEAGRVTGEAHYARFDPTIRWLMLFSCPILHPTSMYRREAVLSAGCYRKEYEFAEDYDLWCRLAFQGTLANYPDKLMKYRLHSKNVSLLNRMRQIDLTGLIAGRYAGQLIKGIQPEVVSELHWLQENGVAPRRFSVGMLASAFGEIKEWFNGVACKEQERNELRSTIRIKNERLRWRCFQLARKELKRPWKAFGWFLAGGKFDEEEGGLWRVLRRGLRRRFGPEGPLYRATAVQTAKG